MAVLLYAIADFGFAENQPLLWHWTAGNLHLLSAFQKTGRSYSLRLSHSNSTALTDVPIYGSANMIQKAKTQERNHPHT